MASNNKYCAGSALFVILAVVLFAASANGQIIPFRGLLVNGTLCCTPTGNCPGGSGIGGVSVGLNCTTLFRGNIQVASGTTTANGTFNITVPALTSSLLGILSTTPCVAVVQLPLNCPLLNATNTILSSSITPIGTLQTILFGFLNLFQITGFFPIGPPPPPPTVIIAP